MVNWKQMLQRNCFVVLREVPAVAQSKQQVYLYFPFTREYRRAPNIAIPDPREPRGVMGVLKTITEARMITTRFTVFVTACVTGATSL